MHSWVHFCRWGLRLSVTRWAKSFSATLLAVMRPKRSVSAVSKVSDVVTCRSSSAHCVFLRCVLSLCLFLSPSASQAAEQWSGWVSWVMDGDTVLLVRAGQHEPVKLRIEGIDAPETCQPGGEAARNAMIAWVLRKEVAVVSQGQDVYGRHIGRMSVDGVDVGAEMVRAGMAWAYKFRTGKGPYAPLQREAQKRKRGLFGTGEQPMSPPVFRKFHGSCRDGTIGY